ncbi:hypothetical protein CVD28_23060 [Bacillus sp. M6-12]|nr:hypothetical protein CVD28_23060 [Bacillus sp. M6-12]
MPFCKETGLGSFPFPNFLLFQFTAKQLSHMLKKRRDRMKLYEMMINHKLNRIQAGELKEIARQYGISIEYSQAEKISKILNGKNINIFDKRQRDGVIKQVSIILGNETAAQIESIFLSLTNT